MDIRKKSSKEKLIPILLIVCILAIVAFVIYKNGGISINGLRNLLEKSGPWAYPIFFIICAFRSFLLLPCGVFSGMAGLIFGPVKGTIVTLTGFTLNAIVIYYTARYFGKDWAERVAKGKLKAADRFLSKNGFMSILLLRVIPILPFDGVSCIGGLWSIRLSSFTLATFIGSIPGVFIYTYFGDSVKSFSVKKIAIALVFIVILSLVPVVYKIYDTVKSRRAKSIRSKY